MEKSLHVDGTNISVLYSTLSASTFCAAAFLTPTLCAVETSQVSPITDPYPAYRNLMHYKGKYLTLAVDQAWL